jgi:hypothetical protein
MVVGLLAGGLAVAFRWVLAGRDAVRNGSIAWAHRYPTRDWLLPVIFLASPSSVT